MERLQDTLRCAGVRTENQYPLSRHSSFRIGGKAKLALFPANREQMLLCLRTVAERGARSLVIGNASNVVFDDNGFDGVVIFTTEWKEMTHEKTQLSVSAGVSLMSVATAAQKASLSGVEFAYGIPGTLGGAVFMNAGAYGGCMADICHSSEYFDAECGETVTLTGDAQGFANRTSFYEKHPQYTILGAQLVLTPDDKDAIAERMRDYLARRRNTQPLGYPSAGSVFKRPEGYFAGKLIEDCGLKGRTVGGAQVSEKHAGFIINRGGATSADVRKLVELIRETVLKQTGVALQCEIRFL